MKKNKWNGNLILLPRLTRGRGSVLYLGMAPSSRELLPHMRPASHQGFSGLCLSACGPFLSPELLQSS